MQRALDGLAKLWERADEVKVHRQPRIQPRLAHRPRPAQPADGLRSDHPRRPSTRKESRGGHFRDDYPEKAAELRQGQPGGSQGRRRDDAARGGARSPRCRRS